MLSAKPDWGTLLQPYLPENTGSVISQLLADRTVHIRVSKPRLTKLGDYRAPYRTRYHRISVNADLNPYAFLVTLVHEIAHMETWINYGRKVKPHGAEWKQSFRELMVPVRAATALPEEIETALDHYLSNPKASSCADAGLVKALRQFDQNGSWQLLEELPEGSLFQLSGGRQFIKGKKRRTRYTCQDPNNGRIYLVSALAEVEHLPQYER